MKQCTKCGQFKDNSCFYAAATGKDGLRADCKECNNVKSQKWYIENREKKKVYNLGKTYNISKNEYDSLIKKQNGCCATCGRHSDKLSRALYVDHCHTKGHIRGLLCVNCNAALGHVKDNVKILEAMIKYLKEN